MVTPNTTTQILQGHNKTRRIIKMDQQQIKCSKADYILGSSDHFSFPTSSGSSCGNSSSNPLCDDQRNIGADNEYILKTIQIRKREDYLVRNISKEELKIRGELESDVERNLEEEIKDEIYHLALRLHRLYQHQKERNAREASEICGDQTKKNKALSEVNISIRLEGGMKLEIKEVKQEEGDAEKGRPWTPSRSENLKAMLQVSKHKKFDWENSLRSDTPPGAINKKNSRSHKAELGWKF